MFTDFTSSFVLVECDDVLFCDDLLPDALFARVSTITVVLLLGKLVADELVVALVVDELVAALIAE